MDINRMKCRIPECQKEVPKWRAKAKRTTCSPKCATDWNHLSLKKRNEIKANE
jgi:endogenous inhibitor of DNA gyrase (YacG/DUF329 family)